MLTNLVSRIGVQNESVREPPTRAIVGADGSLAFEVTTRVWELGGKSLGGRKRFVVFEPAAVRAAVDRAWLHLDPPLVLLQPNLDGRLIPNAPAARDAKVEDLPAPLRDGRHVAWGSRATTRRGAAEHRAVEVELDGRTYAVSLASSFRRHRPPAAAVVAGVLLVPAVVTDVVTFPIQFPLGVYLYGTYFGKADAPDWAMAVMTPAW